MVTRMPKPSIWSIKRRNHPHQSLQQGVALVMVLLFLVAITGLTVWAARQSMLGEGMSRNQQDLEVARQAAESALRDGERDLGGVIAPSGSTPSCPKRTILPIKFTADCVAGLCIRSDLAYSTYQWSTASGLTTSEPWWPTGKGGAWNNDFNNAPPTKPIRTPPSTSNACDSFTGAVPLGTFTGAPAIRGVAVQPEYLIEYFKRSVPGRQEMAVYRVTARGFGYTNRTQVVVQSIFLPE